MTMISPPIFVAEGIDVRVFQSAEDAGRALEPWWVLEKRGQVYDSKGRLLRLKTGKHRVKVLMGERSPDHANELRSLLIDFLRTKNSEADLDQESNLQHLVDTCRKYME